MKVAVTSQDKHSITGNAEKCRKFWVFQIMEGRLFSRELLELSEKHSLDIKPQKEPHPLDNIQVLITGEIGKKLRKQMRKKDVRVIITKETNPVKAVKDLIYY
jgi:predicted Fe-Mo cluster-binding NifX family protein